MKRSKCILCRPSLLLVFLLCMVSFGHSAPLARLPQNVDLLTLKLDDKVLGSRYDVLGLKLGMNADEARRILGSRFHVKESTLSTQGYTSYRETSGFVPGRQYTQRIVLAVTGIGNIVCEFADLPPGEGKGPELLWNISYTALLSHTPDEQAFIDSVHQKFGKPQEETESEAVWGEAVVTGASADLRALQLNYLPDILSKSRLPALTLSKARDGWNIDLSNRAIPMHTDAVFKAMKTSTPPI